jgi:hypothetical protein
LPPSVAGFAGAGGGLGGAEAGFGRAGGGLVNVGVGLVSAEAGFGDLGVRKGYADGVSRGPVPRGTRPDGVEADKQSRAPT